MSECAKISGASQRFYRTHNKISIYFAIHLFCHQFLTWKSIARLMSKKKYKGFQKVFGARLKAGTDDNDRTTCLEQTHHRHRWPRLLTNIKTYIKNRYYFVRRDVPHTELQLYQACIFYCIYKFLYF